MSMFNSAMWFFSKRLYCRYWSARLSRTMWGAIGRESRKGVPPWLVFVIELLRPRQTIRIRVTKAGNEGGK